MRMFGTIVGIILSVSMSIESYGQVPGYLGKRLSIEYSTELAIAFKGVTQNNKGYGDVLTARGDYGSKKEFGLSYNHNAKISYVVSRQRALGIQVSQYFTGMTTTMTSKSILSPEFLDEHHNLHRLNVKSIGLIYTKFFDERGALAPLGSYYNLGIDKIWVTGDIIDRAVYGPGFGDERLTVYNDLSIDQSLDLFAFSIGFGNTQVFYDRFLFKYGAVLRFPIFNEFEGGEEALRGSYYSDNRFNSDPNQVIFEFDTFQRLFSHNFMKLEVGFGILL